MNVSPKTEPTAAAATRPAATPLEYRSPATGTPRVQRLAHELKVAEALGGAAVATKLAVGVPLSLIGPFLIASFLFIIDRRVQADVLPGFGMTLLLACAVVVPWLMWLERRSRGEFFLDAVRGETTPLGASSYGEYELQSAKFGWYAWTEIALTGPRLLWEAIDSLRGHAPVDQGFRLVAAEVVVELLDAGEGLPLRKLVLPERPAAMAQRVVAYLVRCQWADVSSCKDRVWLTSPVRARLARL